MHRLLVAIIVAPLIQPAAGDSSMRTNLLVYQEPGGGSVPVRSVADWQKRRADIWEAMQTVMGRLPGADKRCGLHVRIEEEVDCGAYVRRSISYLAEPGGRVPAYLLIPKALLNNSGRAPAVLSLHSTQSGGNKATAGISPHAGNEHGVELVKRGYVVLAPPYPLLAGYNPDLKALGYESGTMKAIWDNIRALDLLETLPFVKTNHFAAIGHSLGGHNSVYTAVFDPRIQVVVSSCGLDSYRDYMDGNIKGWTSERYMPKLLEYKDRLHELPFDFYEMIATLAPRPCFINAPIGDTNFKWRSVDEIAREARKIYGLYGANDDLRVEHPDCGHDFPAKMREAAYHVIDRALQKDR